MPRRGRVRRARCPGSGAGGEPRAARHGTARHEGPSGSGAASCSSQPPAPGPPRGRSRARPGSTAPAPRPSRAPAGLGKRGWESWEWRACPGTGASRNDPLWASVSALLPQVGHERVSRTQPPSPQQRSPSLLRFPGAQRLPAAQVLPLPSPGFTHPAPCALAAMAGCGSRRVSVSTAQPPSAGAPLEASGSSCTRPLFSSCLSHKQRFRGWALATFPADHSWVLPASPGPPSHLHHIDSIHPTFPWPCTG